MLHSGGSRPTSPFFSDHGYLPSPFYFVKSGIFMDMFHVMFWANNDGRYTEWASVYPPLNFILLQIICWVFLEGVNFQDSFALRDASSSIAVFFVCMYLITPIFVLRTTLWEDFSIKDKILLYLGIVLSIPMLFALERGNLIIFSLIFLAPVLSKSGTARSVSISILINIKPYFVVLLFYYAIKRQWGDLLSCVVMAGGIFLITGIFLDYNFLTFLTNLLSFSKTEDLLFTSREVMSLPSSISVFSYIFSSEKFLEAGSYGYWRDFDLTSLAIAIELIKLAVLGLTLSVLFFRQSHISDSQIIGILIVVITNIGIWVGGYSMLLYIALIPVFMSMKYRWAYFGIVLLIFLPIDIIPIMYKDIGEQYSYLSNTDVHVEWTQGIGGIVRPVLNFFLLIILCYEVAFKLRYSSSRQI
jgi:hypothetical protein